jgi:hypothetical protein
MDIIRTKTKGKHLNTVEKHHIYNISNDDLQMNGTNIDKATINPAFKALQVTRRHVTAENRNCPLEINTESYTRTHTTNKRDFQPPEECI